MGLAPQVEGVRLGGVEVQACDGVPLLLDEEPIGQHALHAGGLEGLRPELRPPRLGSKLTGVEHPLAQHCVDAGPAQQRVLKLVRRAHQLAGCPDRFQGAPVEAGDTRILSGCERQAGLAFPKSARLLSAEASVVGAVSHVMDRPRVAVSDASMLPAQSGLGLSNAPEPGHPKAYGWV